MNGHVPFLPAVLAVFAFAGPAAATAQIVSQSSAQISAAGGVTVESTAATPSEIISRGVVFALSETLGGSTGVSMPGFIAIKGGGSRVRLIELVSDARQAWTGTTTSHETLSLSFGHATDAGRYGPDPVAVVVAQYN